MELIYPPSMPNFSHRSILLCACALLAALILPVAHAEIHSWRDNDGNLHFGDEPPVKGAGTDVRVVALKPASEYSSVALPVVVNTELLMYGTSWCGYCKKARRYFNANGIAFREFDIEKNPSAKRAYDKLRISGVPVIVQDGRTMRGFSAANFERFYQAP